MSKHPYHCVLCGTQLEEAGLMLVCPECHTAFVPTMSDSTLESSVTWLTTVEGEQP